MDPYSSFFLCNSIIWKYHSDGWSRWSNLVISLGNLIDPFGLNEFTGFHPTCPQAEVTAKKKKKRKSFVFE